MGPGARLEGVPEVAIPNPGSRFRQSTLVVPASGATAILWDPLAAGRIVKGQR
ncbi:MAG: hypothetical protein GDA68_04185 [Nitrospira sp. CR2.1]|nr:hypothetical protein [Nitrospira sp. CR2.1]